MSLIRLVKTLKCLRHYHQTKKCKDAIFLEKRAFFPSFAQLLPKSTSYTITYDMYCMNHGDCSVWD